VVAVVQVAHKMHFMQVADAKSGYQVEGHVVLQDVVPGFK